MISSAGGKYTNDMKKFEYKFETILNAYSVIEMSDKMNALGKMGWEAYAVKQNGDSLMIFFKREIPK